MKNESKGHLDDGRVGAGKARPAPGTAKSRVQASDAELTSQIRAKHDKHPFKCGKSNKA